MADVVKFSIRHRPLNSPDRFTVHPANNTDERPGLWEESHHMLALISQFGPFDFDEANVVRPGIEAEFTQPHCIEWSIWLEHWCLSAHGQHSGMVIKAGHRSFLTEYLTPLALRKWNACIMQVCEIRSSERVAVFSDRDSMKKTKRSVCPVACALDVIGDKWTLLVVRDMACGKRYFNDFCRSPERIATNILAERLARLVSSGLVEKYTSADEPGRDAYRLTAKGKSLGPVLISIAGWGLANIKGTWIQMTPTFN